MSKGVGPVRVLELVKEAFVTLGVNDVHPLTGSNFRWIFLP